MSSTANMSGMAEGYSDPITLDADGDGLFLPQELACGSDPDRADADGDALTDPEECASGFDPNLADTDADGVRDDLEYACLGRFPGAPASDRDDDGHADVDEGDVDTDRDGQPDFCDDDSDGDGRPDAKEGLGDDDCDGITNRLDPDDADGSCDSGDDTSTDDSGTDDTGGTLQGDTGCGCATSSPTPLSAIGMLLLGVISRRRRPDPPKGQGGTSGRRTG
jgi:uncharacterized protein (TIGR03382 family)